MQRKLRDGYISGAGRILTSDDPIIKPSLESLRIMEEKHLSSVEMNYPELPPSAENAMPTTAEEIVGAIRSFRLDSSGGPGDSLPYT